MGLLVVCFIYTGEYLPTVYIVRTYHTFVILCGPVDKLNCMYDLYHCYLCTVHHSEVGSVDSSVIVT